MNLRKTLHSGWKILRLLLLTILLTISIAIAATAQIPTTAPIVLDGQKIFQVSGSGQYTAQERADLVNLQLRDAVQPGKPIEIRTEQRNNLPTILLNNRHLLTVTELDAVPGSTPQEQAEDWVRQLQTTIQIAQTERSPRYFREAIMQAIVAIGIAIAISWFFSWVRGQFVHTIHRKLPADEAGTPSAEASSLNTFSKLILVLAKAILWVLTALYIANLFPFTRQWSYQISSILVTSFATPLLTLDQRGYSLIDLTILSTLLFALVIAARILTNFFKLRILMAAGINRGAQEAIAILMKYTLITIGVLILLQLWGLNISSLAILASALGIGIGFGLQDIAKNFVSGLVLVFERPIQIGDFIAVGELNGTVERIGARSTEIRTLDHVSVIVPNSRFLQQEVINWSHRNPVSRLHLPVGVAYTAKPETVRSVLLETANRHPDVLQKPSPQVFFKGFGDSCLNFELLIWITDPPRQFFISSDLYFHIFEALQQNQIEIPFPQHDLHLRSGSLQLSPEVELALLQLSQQLHNGNTTKIKEN